ncbi:MAG: hypothetical protein Aurels2KO_13890 [Aureliella sp.]
MAKLSPGRHLAPRSALEPSYSRGQSDSIHAFAGRRRYWNFIHNQTLEPSSGSAGNRPQDESEETKLQQVEAVLFLSPDGISSRKLGKLAGLADATEARTLIRRLNDKLDATGRAYRIEETAGGYTLMTRSQFAPWLRRLRHIPGELRLSQTALETLAVVAYRQPVLRANVEAIRGVGCSEVLKQLMEWDLVRISGRSEDLGRPYLYGTTSRFLQIFGLRSADRLPRIDWVNAPVADLASQSQEDNGSERKESSMNMTLSSDSVEDVLPDGELATTLVEPKGAIEDDDFFEDDDFDDGEDDDDDDDDDWDDDDDDDEEDGVEDDDTGGWQEVSDDDDGWEDDDDDEEDDDDGWDDEEDDDEWD